MTATPVTLNDVCLFIEDCLHATAPTQEDGFPLIRTPNVGKGRLILEDVYRISQETYDKWTRRARPEPDDLILAREAPAGNVALITEGQEVALGQRTVHLRPDRVQVDPTYLCYYLLTPRMQGALLAGETGATAKHVNMKDIRRLVLRSLHDRDSQTRIAVAITGFDGLIENNRRRIKLLEEAARLIYREWFVHLRFPGHALAKVNNGLPEGWERVEIGNVSPFSYGKGVREHERIPGNVPVVSSSGRMATHNKALVQGPGLVIGRKGNVGTVHLILPDFWPTDTAFYVSGIADIGYLYHAFQSAGFVNTDVAVPGLNRDFAHSRKIVWPTKELRKQFSEMVMSHAAMQFTLERASAKLESARDLLLPRLMSGEIVV